MLRFVIALGALWSFAGCTSSSVRSQEGHACSTNASDDPQYVCTPAQDLVCIATYSRMVTDPKEAMKFDGGIRQVFICRLACNTSVDCPQAGDSCCKGIVFGKTYNKMGGCVPAGYCETETTDVEDGGVSPADAGSVPEAGGGASEAGGGASETGSSAPDAGADAVADASVEG
jgi:hypothetical protein